jgi:hypothetical protein
VLFTEGVKYIWTEEKMEKNLNAELHYIYPSPNISRVVKPRRMVWTSLLDIGVKPLAVKGRKFSLGKLGGDHFENVQIGGRIIIK